MAERKESFGPKPVKEGDVVDVEIAELSKRGDGIARVERFVVFVPETRPGDKVSVTITKVAERFAIAKVNA